MIFLPSLLPILEPSIINKTLYLTHLSISQDFSIKSVNAKIFAWQPDQNHAKNILKSNKQGVIDFLADTSVLFSINTKL